MKRLGFVVLAMMLIPNSLKSQIDIQLGGQIGHVWRASGSLDIGYKLGRSSLQLGYLSNVNCRPEMEYNNVFKRRFFGNNMLERSSLSIRYLYDVKWYKENWNPILAASFAYSFAPVRNLMIFPAAYFEDGEVAYRKFMFESNPVKAFEFYLGLGLKTYLYKKNLYLIQLASAGYNYFPNFQPAGASQIVNMGEFGAKFSLGIGYTFNGHPPKRE